MSSSANGPVGPGPGVLHVRCLVGDQSAHVRPVEEWLGAAARFVYEEPEPERLESEPTDLLLCVNDWPAAVARCLDAARALGIPSLLLQDGILEWRCQYENPLFGAGGGAPQHQPILADRIACIGPQSARQLARWGNEGRVEVTGMPRLDALLARESRPPGRPGARVLVMTAKNPGFTAEQRATTLRSLRDLRAALDRRPGVEVAWRVSRGLVPELGIVNRLEAPGGRGLAEQLEWADAVVTTPSTVMLESMLLGRPVAALDYHNAPRFVPTAWTASAPEHVDPVLDELLDPPAAKMAFQADCLEDCLRCDGPAAPRVGGLIRRMVSEARGEAAARTDADGRVASGRDRAGDGARRLPPLASLYPGQPVFELGDPEALRVRLARFEKENERLRESLSRRGPTGRLRAYGRVLARRLGNGG